MLDHSVGINAKTCFAIGLFFEVREDVHARGVPPEEKRLVLLLGALQEINSLFRHLLVDGLHALFREGPGVFDTTIREAMNHAARAEFLFELRVLRIIGVLRLLLGIKVVEISKKFIKTVTGRQHIVSITEMVFSELAGDITLSLEKCRDGWILFFHALRCAGETDFGQAGANRGLAGNESRAPRSAGLLAIPVGEIRAPVGDAVDVRSAITHHTTIDRTDVELADVVAPDHENIGFFLLR